MSRGIGTWADQNVIPPPAMASPTPAASTSTACRRLTSHAGSPPAATGGGMPFSIASVASLKFRLARCRRIATAPPTSSSAAVTPNPPAIASQIVAR
jgi:hypothetical protein